MAHCVRGVAADEQAARQGWLAGVFGRWGQSREERQPQSGFRASVCQTGWREGCGHRGAGRRLHGEGGGHVHHYPHSESRQHHSTRGGVPGCDLALVCLASKVEAPSDKMGEHGVTDQRRQAPPNGRARAVFLDRDGVINRPIVRDGKPYPPGSVEEFEIYPEVADACAAMKRAGYLLVVVTNQPDVGRGSQSLAIVEDMHAKMCQNLPIDRVEVCYDPGEGSAFFKPAPGMLLRSAGEL